MLSRPESGVILISEGAYRLLLRLYPRDFRAACGIHMSRTFRDVSRERYARDGILGLAGLWLFTALDAVKTALEERAQAREWIMSKDTAIRIGAPAMMVAGASWAIGGIGRFDGAAWAVIFPAFIGQFVGLLGLNAYASGSVNRATRLVSMLAVVVSGLAIFLVFGSSYYYEAPCPCPPFEQTLLVSLVVLFACLGVLGVQLLREPLLPRGSGAWLLLSAPLGVVILLSVLQWFGIASSGEPPSWALAGAAVVAGLGLGLLGYAMLPSRKVATVAGRA